MTSQKKNVSQLKKKFRMLNFSQFIEVHVKNFQNLKNKIKKIFKKYHESYHIAFMNRLFKNLLKIFQILIRKKKNFQYDLRIRKICSQCKFRVTMFQNRKSKCQHQNSNDEMHFRLYQNVDANFFVVIIWNIVDCKNNESIISRNCLSTIFFFVFFSLFIFLLSQFFSRKIIFNVCATIAHVCNFHYDNLFIFWLWSIFKKIDVNIIRANASHAQTTTS